MLIALVKWSSWWQMATEDMPVVINMCIVVKRLGGEAAKRLVWRPTGHKSTTQIGRDPSLNSCPDPPYRSRPFVLSNRGYTHMVC